MSRYAGIALLILLGGCGKTRRPHALVGRTDITKRADYYTVSIEGGKQHVRGCFRSPTSSEFLFFTASGVGKLDFSKETADVVARNRIPKGDEVAAIRSVSTKQFCTLTTGGTCEVRSTDSGLLLRRRRLPGHGYRNLVIMRDARLQPLLCTYNDYPNPVIRTYTAGLELVRDRRCNSSVTQVVVDDDNNRIAFATVHGTLGVADDNLQTVWESAIAKGTERATALCILSDGSVLTKIQGGPLVRVKSGNVIVLADNKDCPGTGIAAIPVNANVVLVAVNSARERSSQNYLLDLRSKKARLTAISQAPFARTVQELHVNKKGVLLLRSYKTAFVDLRVAQRKYCRTDE